MTDLKPNAPGDGRGHGTFVARIAAGSPNGNAGGSPNAKIVTIDVMNDNGMASTTDVIPAADYVVENKERLNINVLNISLHATTPASIFYDPLERAVEAAWFNGITVVAAAGNYRKTDSPSGVHYAPGNDPFVITVGASGHRTARARSDDERGTRGRPTGTRSTASPKPELGAPGRYVIGRRSPAGLDAAAGAPLSAVVADPATCELSGTSFAAPGRRWAPRPTSCARATRTWTPDQVKGALMLTARRVLAVREEAAQLGVGEVDGREARAARRPLRRRTRTWR